MIDTASPAGSYTDAMRYPHSIRVLPEVQADPVTVAWLGKKARQHGLQLNRRRGK